MKQKLVLISSIFSLGYDFCSLDITELNSLGSSGFVSGELSTSCERMSGKYKATEETHHLLIVFIVFRLIDLDV